MSEAHTEEREVTWDEVKPGSPAHEKMLAAAMECCDELSHLAWPRDVKDMQHASDVIQNPESNYGSWLYAYELIGEVAERLREARDFPEKHILRRWQDLQFTVAVSAGRDPIKMLPFLKLVASDFSVVQPPDDESDLLAVATSTVASLLDVLTSTLRSLKASRGRSTPSSVRRSRA